MDQKLEGCGQKHQRKTNETHFNQLALRNASQAVRPKTPVRNSEGVISLQEAAEPGGFQVSD